MEEGDSFETDLNRESMTDPGSVEEECVLRSSVSKSRTGSSNRDNRVSFAEGTAPGPEANLAVSIPGYKIDREKRCVFYTVTVSFGGRLLSLKRRYSDFTALRVDMIVELLDKGNIAAASAIPALPGKRWFEVQRWINRFDHRFTTQRRLLLQDFLRNVCRCDPHSGTSPTLATFLQTGAIYDWEAGDVGRARHSSSVARSSFGSSVDDEHFGPGSSRNVSNVSNPEVTALVTDLRAIIEGSEMDDSVSSVLPGSQNTSFDAAKKTSVSPEHAPEPDYLRTGADIAKRTSADADGADAIPAALA